MATDRIRVTSYLDPEDYAWYEDRQIDQDVPLAHLVRVACKEYRKKIEGKR